MISIKQYERILNNGLLLDHYLVLCSIRDGEELPKTGRIDGFINLLNKKGYIEDGSLTSKAYEIIDIHPTIKVEKDEVETPKFDFAGWVTNLHKKCQDKLLSLTGKSQVTSKIKGAKKGFPFLPNVTDLGKKLLGVITLYKLSDMDLIEETIMKHIDNCSKSGEWFPLIKYYISKDGISDLVTDMESVREGISDKKSTQRFVK